MPSINCSPIKVLSPKHVFSEKPSYLPEKLLSPRKALLSLSAAAHHIVEQPSSFPR
jgi:hypothetical protein